MRSILLAGGAGYIGSHTAKLLARSGFVPVVLDNLSTGNRWAVKWGPLIEGNIRDYSLVKRILHDYDIAAVVHFAASAYVGESMKVPKDYFDNNVVASLEFLRAIIDSNTRLLVFSSSCATYGDPVSERISELHPQRPVNPYGETKLMIERALHWYGGPYGLRSVCLRYFNAAGADEEGEIGECHDPETHLIPLAIHSAFGIRPWLDLYGTDYSTPDGSAVRDYIHVSDLARAHVMALEYLLNGNASAAVNLGNGQGHSVKSVVQVVEEIAGRKIPTRVRDRRPGDPASLVADPTLAMRTLGWAAQHSDLKNIVQTALHWYSLRGTRSV
jgi:UDP-arabinose 4-epimerase